LRERAAEFSDVDKVIEDLKRARLLDDGSYAENRARSLLSAGKLGPRGAVARLRAKGIDGATAAKAVETALGDSSEEALAVKALAGRRYGPDASDKENARAARFLLGRGFGGALVSRILRLRTEVEFGDE
jgi:SOS response regulatory protein OraA/RecX